METRSPLVLVVDDDPGVRKSLARLIDCGGWRSRTFTSATELMSFEEWGDAFCILLDIRMPGVSGPQLHEWLLEKGIRVPIAFLTAYGDVPTGVRAIKRGAIDFLLKPVNDEVLLATIRNAIVVRGCELSREMHQEEIKQRHACLTSREREVMGHVVDGRLNKQIASDLGISLKTVKVHRARAMGKMGVRSVAALVHACTSAGIGENDH
jgi:FixJ family two-component response regulator